jgi:sulfite exporter TauE/SafE
MLALNTIRSCATVYLAGSHLIGGALLGLAGSLHCAGICGGIASTLLMATSPGAAKSGAAALLKIQLGRALSYTICGALVGGSGAAFAHLVDLSGMQVVLRALAACMLIWSGCSVAGMVHGFSAFDRVLVHLANAARPPWLMPSARTRPIVMGVIWGFAPCGMVYAALLNATMTATASGGAEFMAGFGLATIPAVASAAYGVSALVGLGRSTSRATLRRVLGGAITALGIVSLVEPAASLSALCLGG